ncbi:hemagglutinin-like protein [Erwinia rhapontici]|uniref:hemagglutinin repeat-containing protein n=2 Tax=Erwinia rhapontici TaxID=55212 RepID=UPI001BB416EE|nr:hemagglutinin repeat-containing protein [Erwinia rhapontici]BCQ41948.1 hemagglutinin-like protein [Erwinia rhapontici]
MNKHCYRLIFSRTHGELRVVSELARSCSSEPGQSRGIGAPRLWVTVRRVVWMLGLSLFAAPTIAAGIVADGSAPAGQRPQVIATQNGLPQVNIAAPNRSGVSHNQYRQFDVDKRGAILNNSASMTSTQLAGMIQGNPNLKLNSAPARVILNEVNSSNPSELRGFLEVAGGRAQVIVANPAGIVCNGCGTINAGRMTLTTGKTQLNADGSLAGYQVERGTVRIEGGGLNGDARHDTEYVDVLARAVDVNAGVWAKQGLNVVAGRNRISADAKTVSALATDGKAPELAIDMGQMGGMYSGHIRMIGTEAGVGVRNQGGHIQAEKTLTVSSEGKLTWQPGKQEAVTEAGGDIQLAARDSIEHHGKLHSGGTLSVDSREGDVKQSGTLAAVGDVTLKAKRGITSSGNLLAGSDANSVLTQDADLTLTSQGDIQASGKLLSKKDVKVSGQRVDLSQSTLAARRADIRAQAAGVALKNAKVDSAELIVNTAGSVAAQQAQVSAGRWDINADSLSVQRGIWSQTGEGESRFALSGQLDNTDGSIEARQLSLTSATLTNQNGRLVALNDTAQHWQVSGLLDNTHGALGSNGDLTLAVEGGLDNRGGLIFSDQQLDLTVNNALDNQGGTVRSSDDQRIVANHINNRQGLFSSGAGLELTAQQLDNPDGTLISYGKGVYHVATLNNQQGKLHSGDALAIEANEVNNQDGQLVATRALDVHTTQLNNQDQGKISSQQALTVQADRLNNRDGGLLLGTTDTDVTARTLDNRAGSVQSAGTLTLSLLETLDNRQGRVVANQALTIQGGNPGARSAGVPALDLINQGGVVQSGATLSVQTHTLNNQGGTLLSQQDLNLAVRQDYTHRAGDTLSSNGTVTLSVAGVLTNLTDWLLPGGLIVNSQDFTNQGSLVGKTLHLTTGLLLNRGRLEADSMTLNVDTLDNPATLIGDNIIVRGRVIDNHGNAAVIAATDRLDLHSGERLTNRDGGLLYSSGSLFLGSDDLIENRASSIEADGDVTVEAKRLNNLREGLNIARNAASSDYSWHRYNYYWRSYGSDVGRNKNTMTPTTQRLTFKDDAAAASNRYGTLLAIDAGSKRAQVRVKNSQGVMTNLWVNYLALKPNADGSYAMTFYETRGYRQNTVPTPYQNTVWREHDQGRLEQWDPNKHLDIADAPYVSDYNNLRERTVTGTVTRDKLVSAGVGAHILAGGNMVLRVAGQLLNDASTLSANGDLNVAGAKNIVNKGYSVNERRQEHIVDHYDRDTNHWYPTFNRDETTALTTIDAIMTGNGSVTIQGASIENVTVNQAQISSVAAAEKAAQAGREEWERNPLTANEDGTQPLTPGELALANQQQLDRVATSIPNNGLFRQDTAKGSPFMVVTDERFTSRSKFISSDYLLDRVGYDPALVIKRLGDGFYEQRLVREQMLALTGRPSVKGEDAMAQYQNLMNNGSKVAQDFHLVPGVALTPAQIAALQQDIVWLVSETVDSAEGPQTVWVPKVYLANNTVRLSGDGALIAGGNLQLSANSLSNAGNLVADQALKIDADQFLHQGGDIRADSINVQATHLTLSTNLQDALRQASMSASDINLSGTDVTLQGAKLDATQNLSVSAQNSLEIGAARSSQTASFEVISGAMGNRTRDGMEDAGSRKAQVSGEWQQALGSSLNAGGNLSLNAGQDVILQGSQAKAGGSTQLQAGGDVKLLAETTTNTTHLKANSSTSSVSNTRQEDRLLLSTLSGDQGVTLVAGKNLRVEGAQVDSQKGSIGVSAQDVIIKEVRQVVIDQDSEKKREGKTKSQREMETVRDTGIGSTFSGEKGVTVIAREGDIAVAGSTLHSEDGAIALQAKRDVLISSATDRESQFSEERSEKKGFLSKSSSHTIKDDRSTLEQGSLLSGESVSINAGRDLAVVGSAIAADNDVTLAAGNNVDIVAATETQSHYLLEEKKKSGLMSSGGIGFTVGSQSTRHQVDEKGTTQSQSVSTVGSSQGNVSITAGNRAHIGGADVVAGKDIAITGDSVLIDPGYDKRTSTETFESKQSGFTLALSGAVGSALNTAVSTAQQARKEGDGRLQALQGTKAVLSGVQGAQAYSLAEAGGSEGSVVGVNLSYGSQSSKSETTTKSSQSQGSSLTAGDNLTVTATGKGKGPDSGDISIAGSQLQAGKDVSLNAARDVNLVSAENTQSLDGKNESHGASVGVGINFGQGANGLSLNASVNKGRGSETGNGATHSETTVNAGNNLSITSGRDATLHGAQVSGEKVVMDVGRDLTLSSQQDEDYYDSKQQSVSAGGSISFSGGSGSVNASRDKMHSSWQSVQEQTGVFAGSGGYDITVGKHTQLDGAVIGSTATADKNRLDTGTLGFSNIENRAEYQVEHQSVGISSGGSVAGQFVGNMANGLLAGMNGSGSDSSTTKAAVSEGTIVIRDAANQRQDVEGLSRDVEHANQTLSPIFDKEREQRRLKEALLIGEIGSQAADIARTQGQIEATKAGRAELEKQGIRQPGDKATKKEREAYDKALTETAGYKTAQQKWGTGSAIQQGLQAATAAVQGLAGGDLKAAIAGASAPYIAEIIKQTAPNEASRIMAHAAVAGVIAAAQGNSAAAGAAGAATTALMGEAIKQSLYGDVPVSQLNEDQKQTLVALGSLAAGLAGGLAGGSTADAIAGAQAGQNEISNNMAGVGMLSQMLAQQTLNSAAMAEAGKGNVNDQAALALTKAVKDGLSAGCLANDACVLMAIVSAQNQSESDGSQNPNIGKDLTDEQKKELGGTGTGSGTPPLPENDPKKSEEKKIDKLNQKQESAMRKIDNLIKNSLKDHDITGSLKDMDSNPIPKPDGSGQNWNHMKEMQDTLNGLRNHANTLKNVNNPEAQVAYGRAKEAINKIESAIKGYGI